jgi:hypothetical protein
MPSTAHSAATAAKDADENHPQLVARIRFRTNFLLCRVFASLELSCSPHRICATTGKSVWRLPLRLKSSPDSELRCVVVGKTSCPVTYLPCCSHAAVDDFLRRPGIYCAAQRGRHACALTCSWAVFVSIWGRAYACVEPGVNCSTVCDGGLGNACSGHG